MNIGIDLDHTITACPEFFAFLTRALRDGGHCVYVVSFRDPADLAKSKAEVADHAITCDGVYHPREDENIPGFKARMARELELDVFFDDMPEAFTEMPPSVQRFWLCDPEVYDLKRMIDVLGSGMLNFDRKGSD